MRLQAALFAAAATLFAGSAFASSVTTAELATPYETAERVVAASRVWTCEGSACVAVTDEKRPSSRTCRELAREVGPVLSYGSEDGELDEAGLERCNARAKDRSES